MAAFAKPTNKPSVSTVLIPYNAKISGLYAGEDLDWMDPCYIKSDGKAWKSNGTNADAAAKVRGYAAMPAAAGLAVTLVFGIVVGWDNSASPGTDLYLSATGGALQTTASTGGTAPIGFTIDATRVFLFQSKY